MNTEKIIETITNIFEGADERDWNKVKASFANDVLLDYYSMNGSPATVLSSNDIIKAWKGFLPGFDLTHHYVTKFEIEQSVGIAKAHFSGKADHFIDGESWTVEGSYDLELAIVGDDAKVTKFKFNLQSQGGNVQLSQRAVDLAAKK
ncbi:nuclear transport factor 2 family protein [Mucilaginibacter sp. BT774]|uniref:nuclear transport factor 2 family protein n=1 Tax=Mucilaginibacter sp. BT774 TaxID=3062276 RepID=UPI002675B15B|nr:nuclear transport factor 2 family protein [Mucilaginibacter sp. BT774]MDO3625098.1 nuclear transport factor 2 family protein [Mucilaginibacter sp. BT774]